MPYSNFSNLTLSALFYFRSGPGKIELKFRRDDCESRNLISVGAREIFAFIVFVSVPLLNKNLSSDAKYDAV